MPITQDRLVALIVIGDELISRSKTLLETHKRLLTIAKSEGGGSAPSPLLFQIIEDLGQAIAHASYLGSTAINHLATEREHFRKSEHNNKRTAEKMRLQRRNLELETPVDISGEIEDHSTVRVNIADIQPQIFSAFQENPNKDWSLSTQQLFDVIEQTLGISNDHAKNNVVKELLKHKIITMPKIPGEFFLAE
jgi:hypothetical protein